jgi:hypothetical protein
MPCRSCNSTIQELFRSETSVHAPSRIDSLNLPQLLIYPAVLICLNCGFSEFQMSEEMRRELPGLGATSQDDS